MSEVASGEGKVRRGTRALPFLTSSTSGAVAISSFLPFFLSSFFLPSFLPSKKLFSWFLTTLFPILSKSLEERRKTTQWSLLPFGGLSSGDISREQLNRHREPLRASRPRSSKSGIWRDLVHLKFFLRHSLLSSSLLCLLSLQEQAAPPEGAHGRWCHACAELPRPASATVDQRSEFPCCMGMAKST